MIAHVCASACFHLRLRGRKKELKNLNVLFTVKGWFGCQLCLHRNPGHQGHAEAHLQPTPHRFGSLRHSLHHGELINKNTNVNLFKYRFN